MPVGQELALIILLDLDDLTVWLTWLDPREGVEELAYDRDMLAACAKCFLSSKTAGRYQSPSTGQGGRVV